MTLKSTFQSLLKRPSKISLLLFAYGFSCYLLFFLSAIPAQQLWQLIPQQNKSQLHIANISGTIWSGQLDGLQVTNLALGQLRWELNLLPLLFGQIDLNTHINGSLGKLNANITRHLDGSIQATNISGEIPAEVLNPYTLPATLDGEIKLNIETLVYIANEQLQLEGEVLWRKASISMLKTMEIGDVTIISKADGNDSILRLSNKNSALGIEGNIKLSANGRYNLNLALLNRDTSRKDIRTLLQMIGKVDATGKVNLKRQGQVKF